MSCLPRVARSNALCMLPVLTHAYTCLRLGAGADAVLIVHLFSSSSPRSFESDDADVRLRLRHPRLRRPPLRHPRLAGDHLSSTLVAGDHLSGTLVSPATTAMRPPAFLYATPDAAAPY